MLNKTTSGQQAAYRAYRNYVDKQLNGVEEPRLPGLEEYTPNQIFWISYGFSWCEKITQDALVQQVDLKMILRSKDNFFIHFSSSSIPMLPQFVV